MSEPKDKLKSEMELFIKKLIHCSQEGDNKGSLVLNLDHFKEIITNEEYNLLSNELKRQRKAESFHIYNDEFELWGDSV